jgi:hypothetical protein
MCNCAQRRPCRWSTPVLMTQYAGPGKNPEGMNDILEQIKERLLDDTEWAGSASGGTCEPEKWCRLLRHQTRLADRAACSLATDEITAGEEQRLIIAYRGRLISIAAAALAAAESLDRVLEERRRSSDKEGDLAKRSEGRASRRLKK